MRIIFTTRPRKYIVHMYVLQDIDFCSKVLFSSECCVGRYHIMKSYNVYTLNLVWVKMSVSASNISKDIVRGTSRSSRMIGKAFYRF